jgi:hypothetical protein
MSVFRDFLLWLEEHQAGILTTIAVHLLIISVVLVLKIKTNAERDYQIMIDLSQINARMEEEQQEEKPPQQEMSTQELVQNMRQEYHIRNIPVNTVADRAVENIDKMVRDIKTEMNITDPPSPQDTPEEAAPKEEKLENEARIYEDKYPMDATGERTIYKGPTTVSYELSGRRHAWMPAPVYKCRTGGRIVVDIVVNGNGYVLAAEINKSKSNSEDPCIVEAAVRDAERSRFNESSMTKQQGSITYIFQAQ